MLQISLSMQVLHLCFKRKETANIDVKLLNFNSYLLYIVHYSVSPLDLHFWMWKDRWLKAMAIADYGYKHRIKTEILKCMEGKFPKGNSPKGSIEVITILNGHVAAYRWEILSAHKLRNTMITIFIFMFIDFEAFLLCLIDIVFMVLENIQIKSVCGY